MSLDNGSHHQRIYGTTRYGLHEGGRHRSGPHCKKLIKYTLTARPQRLGPVHTLDGECGHPI
eukprot:12708610-Heterocapsa_arctica.AAC.1